ncbi:MAG: hypothetical protein RJB66_1149 [Pseudomonadota bacterium]
MLFGVVLGAIILYTMRTFAKPEEPSSGADLKSLEEGIKKILESHAQASHGSPAVDSDPAKKDEVLEGLNKQIEELKDQLVHKHEELEQLKSHLAAAPAGEAGTTTPASEGSGDTVALEAKVKDLEARLAEYAVIEDDIADLSLYKEENARLLAEVEQLKTKMMNLQADSGVARSIPSLEPMPVSEPTPTPTPEPVPVTAAAPTPEPALEKVATSDAADDAIMAEFEKAVAEQKVAAKAEAEVTATEGGPLAGDEQEPEANVAPESASDALQGEINIDKMMSEVNALPSDAEVKEGENALEQTVDTDKLLEEASSMEKVDTEALNKFDEFLKKEGA